jgi:hypothetical protein
MNIELIIAPSIPHRVFDYALYVAADILNIKFLTFKMTVWPGYIIPMFDIHKIPSFKKNSSSVIDEEIINYYDKVNSSYDIAEPKYMKRQASEDSKSIFRRILNYIGKYKFSFFANLFETSTTYWKKKGDRIQDSRFTKAQFFVKIIKGFRFKKNLKKYYESICDSYDKGEKYVFVALHYQPEETSCPSGKIFVDQTLMVESLSKNLPDDIKIYVKEHPSQFNAKMEGQTGRNIEVYDKLRKINNVKLISTSINSFKIIDNSLAVATLTGTVGMEALIRRKCAIVFGTAWYEKLPGILKISQKRDLENIFINMQAFKYDKQKLLQGLTDIRTGSIQAYHYKGMKKKSLILKEEAIENLSSYLLDLV